MKLFNLLVLLFVGLIVCLSVVRAEEAAATPAPAVATEAAAAGETAEAAHDDHEGDHEAAHDDLEGDHEGDNEGEHGDEHYEGDEQGDEHFEGDEQGDEHFEGDDGEHDPFEHQTFEDFKASFTGLGVTLDAAQEEQIKKLFDQMEAARAAQRAEEEKHDAEIAAQEQAAGKTAESGKSHDEL